MTAFVELAALADVLAAEGSRLKKRAAIAAAIGVAASRAVDDAGLFAQYLAGQPFAEADRRKLNAGGALLTRALLAVSGATDAALTAAYRRHGDLGAAGFDLLVAKDAAGEPLSLQDVETAFAALAAERTTAARAAIVEALLRRASAIEAKYLLKLMLGDMRIGVKQSLVEEGIAVAASAAGHAASAAEVRHAVMLEADLTHTVRRAFAGTLGEARMTLFHPLGFMLASPVDTPEEAVARFTEKPAPVAKAPKPRKKKGAPEDVMPVEVAEEAYADDVEAAALPAVTSAGVLAFLEDKFDGMRAQIHCGESAQPGRVALYSRNREDITASFPDLAEAFAAVREPMILDGEILGWDFAAARALPFAVMGQRIGRKLVSDDMRRQIPVVFMGFDLLFAGGELLLPLPLTERRRRLEDVAAQWGDVVRSGFRKPAERAAQSSLFQPASKGDDEPMPLRWLLSPVSRVADAEAIDVAYRDARARKNEGVMLKAAESLYLPGRRGLAWVKLKRELATLDVVITGAEFGSGRRAQMLSDYTFAVRDEGGALQNVGKAYSGVTDVEIATLTAWLKEHTIEDFGHFRTVEPQIVLEVAFNNIMRSDRHSSGFALRFPRILRLRDDKPVAEIDTVERVEEIYQSQPDRPDEDA